MFRLGNQQFHSGWQCLDESVAESTISESTDGNEAAEGTETGEESSEASTVDGETDAEAKDNSLRNYEVLYQDMLEVTEKPNERW